MTAEMLEKWAQWKNSQQGHLPNSLSDYPVIGDAWYWMRKAFEAGAESQAIKNNEAGEKE